MKPLHLIGMGGTGDCVYSRPLVRQLVQERGEIWYSTPYPELVEDIPGVHPVRWGLMRLRCQSKSMDATPGSVWSKLPPGPLKEIRIQYYLHSLRRSVVEDMEWWTKEVIEDFRFDLPDFGPSPIEGAYVVIRPVSVRTEWMNSARNPDPKYVTAAARQLMARGYRVVCVGDLEDGQETLVGDLPPADTYLIRGELGTRQLFALIRHATLVLGGVGWIVPTCLAYRTTAVIIGGGLAQHSAPEFLVDRRMDASRMEFLLPDPYCWCRSSTHACKKAIPQFEAKLNAALDRLLA
jgi:hypothetical protein